MKTTTAILYLIGGHKIDIAPEAAQELVRVLNNRPKDLETVVIRPGVKLTVDWDKIVAIEEHKE